MLIDAQDEVLEEGIAEAGGVVQRGDVALVVGPLVHGEADEIPAVDLEHVDEVGKRDVGVRAGVAGDHDEGLVEVVGLLDVGEHVGDLNGVDAGGHDDLRLGLGVRGQDVLLGHGAQPRHHVGVECSVRDPVRRLESKIAHGILLILVLRLYQMVQPPSMTSTAPVT